MPSKKEPNDDKLLATENGTNEPNLVDDIPQTKPKKRKASVKPANEQNRFGKNYTRPEKNTIEYLIFLTVFGHQGSSFVQTEANTYHLDITSEIFATKLQEFKKCRRIFEQLEMQEDLWKHFTKNQYEKQRTAGYFDVITKPVDFYGIEYKMKSILYANWAEEETDLRLMCENARVWNKHTEGKYKEEMDAADELEELLDQLLKEYLAYSKTKTKLSKIKNGRTKKAKLQNKVAEEETDQGMQVYIAPTNRDM
jgi:hypothetical protein